MLSLGTSGVFATLVFSKFTQQRSFPAPVVNGPVPFKSIIGNESLDDLKLPTANSTAMEGWYLDTLASDLSTSVVFNIGASYSTIGLTAAVEVSYPNGSVSLIKLPDTSLNISAIGKGSTGEADSNSWGWTSTSSLSSYNVHFDLPQENIRGDITLESLGPSHVRCSEALSGASYEYSPGFYWVNNFPDAKSTVDLTINGTRIAFTGSGYEDKLWGFSASENLDQWYWGRGRAGGYSVVWYYRLNTDGTTFPSAYVLKDSKVVYAGCDDNVVVRPFGKGYPLSDATGDLQGYTINVDAGSIGKFAFTSQQTQLVLNSSLLSPDNIYQRWIGNLTGGVVGGTNTTGTSLWELVYVPQ